MSRKLLARGVERRAQVRHGVEHRHNLVGVVPGGSLGPVPVPTLANRKSLGGADA